MTNHNDNPIAVIIGTIFSIAFVSSVFKAILLSCVSAVVGALVAFFVQRWLIETFKKDKDANSKEEK